MQYRFTSEVSEKTKIDVLVFEPTAGDWDMNDQKIRVWSTGKVEVIYT